MLNEGTLVLEGVTLAQVVELVVEVLVDLAGGTVADEETTENTHAAHPDDGNRHTRVGGTFALTRAGVSAFSFRLSVCSDTGARVHLDRAFCDVVVLDQLADGISYRCVH